MTGPMAGPGPRGRARGFLRTYPSIWFRPRWGPCGMGWGRPDAGAAGPPALAWPCPAGGHHGRARLAVWRKGEGGGDEDCDGHNGGRRRHNSTGSRRSGGRRGRGEGTWARRLHVTSQGGNRYVTAAAAGPTGRENRMLRKPAKPWSRHALEWVAFCKLAAGWRRC